MKLYNTLNKQVEEIAPINPPNVTIYTCGPTVYDYPHIGNWFTFIRYELLVRALILAKYSPEWVMNITDVGHLISDADEGEDKLEKGARRDGKTAWDVAEFYGKYFTRGLKRLNFLMPTYMTKATEHIIEQIELVKKLESKGFTYIIDDGVYYDTAKFPSYADFAQLDIDEMQAGKRVSLNPQKRNPTDFALWKFSPTDHKRDMEWDSPWGKGFPGWHLECSAMAIKYLGETIDIHAGGIDHLPVHHTNEIAQSEGATGKVFAHYWMHTNHILIEGEKIAKSSGNGITLEDIEKKGFSLEAFRLLVLESHYRTQSKFSWTTLEDAHNRLEKYKQVAALQHQSHDSNSEIIDFTSGINEISSFMDNDLDTPRALASINILFSKLELNKLHVSQVDDFKNYLNHIDSALGLNIAVNDISQDQKSTLTERKEYRKSGDWNKSDELRDKLKSQGIAVLDTGDTTYWYWLE